MSPLDRDMASLALHGRLPEDTPHVHEYRCSCGESCPHVAARDEALREAREAIEGLWDVLLIDPSDPDPEDVLTAALAAIATLDGEQVDEAGVPQRSQGNARGGG